MARHRSRSTILDTAIRIAIAGSVIGALTAAAPVCSQEPEAWRTVDNPYQEDLEFSFGSTLTPGVEVDRVRWRSLRMDAADADSVAAGEPVDVEISLELENRDSKSAKALVILLLENGGGSPLERIEIKLFKVGGERLKERTETVSLSGDVVLATSRIYLFCEITR